MTVLFLSGTYNDGLNADGLGQRGRQGRGPAGHWVKEQEGTWRAGGQWRTQHKREETEGEGRGMGGRGRGGRPRTERGGGKADANANWREPRGRCEGLGWRERGGRPDSMPGHESDEDQHRRRGRWGERPAFVVGRNRQPGGAEREDTRRQGQSRDQREGAGPEDRKMGYKKLEELFKEDSSVVAIALSSSHAFHVLLRDTKMRQDLIQLICKLLNKAFMSKIDRSTLQHLACIVKDSRFFQSTLLHYVGGMVSESSWIRRAQYPQCLENILDILTEVNKAMNV